MDIGNLTSLLPLKLRRRIEPVLEMIAALREVRNLKAVTGMLPSAFRGVILQQGRQNRPTLMYSGHPAHFEWNYRSDFPQMRELYRRAKQNQWDAETTLDWSIDVDPENPEVPLMVEGVIDPEALDVVVTLSWSEKMRLGRDMTAWMLSQFLHGEQGALFAAAQVTESVQWSDGKLYGATQVMDEGRHVEVFHRYIDEKLNKLYVINDNLFTIIDGLMTDSRWDMKFLGMQIMVEGLALGAFSTLYRLTREPLLKSLLRYVIQDEARHVHYGVLALKEHILEHLSERERRERQDWAFEVALLMRNRFMAHEVYEEWFEGLMTRRQWNDVVTNSPGMKEFRQVMFSRLIPNLRELGLMPQRMMQHYEDAGLLQFITGASAAEMSETQILDDLDHGATDLFPTGRDVDSGSPGAHATAPAA